MLALCLCLLTFNVVLAGLAWLVCRVCDAAEQPASPEPESRPVDEEFAAIVAASLADLRSRWADPS